MLRGLSRQIFVESVAKKFTAGPFGPVRDKLSGKVSGKEQAKRPVGKK